MKNCPCEKCENSNNGKIETYSGAQCNHCNTFDMWFRSYWKALREKYLKK